MDREALIDRVTERTRGTAGDPLTRDEVAQVVNATLDELGAEPLSEQEQEERQQAADEAAAG